MYRPSPVNRELALRVLQGRCACGNHATATISRDGQTVLACGECLAAPLDYPDQPAATGREPGYLARLRRKRRSRDSGRGSAGWQYDAFRGHSKRPRSSKAETVTLSAAAMARRSKDNPYGLTARQLAGGRSS